MNLEASLGVDQLWKYQLRREHAALLDEMDAQKNAFTAFAGEAKAAQECLQAQLTDLKSKFDKLEHENEKQAQEIKDYLRAVQEGAAEAEKIRTELKAVGVQVNIATGLEDNAAETIAFVPTPTLKAHLKAPTKTLTMSPSRRGSPRSTGVVNTKLSHNAANTGLRKSRRQAYGRASTQAPKVYAKLPQPPLNQDSICFEDYFQRVDKISSIIDPANQTPLAAMFITGLAEREDQDAIVDELSTKGMSEVLGNGQVEMKCSWEDLKKVLKTVGLIGTPDSEKGDLTRGNT